ncbi:MAG TPA: zinc-binding dehydrogenase [Candidatus Acidoferrales bacterium]|nr:zinc-binding dehydrogenase [Candidatus Acidoferrales bacterium]
MAEMILAATQVGSRRIEVREYPLPEISADDALLKVEIAGICGSDIGGYLKFKGEPHIKGHENVGFIAKIGSGAAQRWGVKEGDRVVVEQYLPCGTCRWCRGGEYRFCDQTDKLPGRVILRYGNTPVSVWPSLWGGFSQYLYLPPNAIVHKLPARVPAEQAALFVALANGMQWAYLQGGAAPGKTVVIQGPGQMGLACVVASKEAGAACVIVSGLGKDAKRFEVARKLGADHTIDVEKESLRERVREITGGQGADVIVNVSRGGKETVREALDLASKIGTIVLAGPGEQQIPTTGFGRKLITMKWVQGSSFAAFELGLQVLASGRYPLGEMATHQFDLDHVNEAMRTFIGEQGEGAIHVSIRPGA